ALLLIPCASILVPLPSTNTAPGIGVTIAAIGLIERDGLLVIFGLTLGLAWVLLLVLLGAEGIQLIKTWLMTR
ncbi:MAG: exopolysaccharide biosynthesis protein, partial [Pseudomonadota bacterium]